MPKKFERTAVLLVLAASPFWLPAIPSQVGSALRSTLMEWLRPVFSSAVLVRQGVGGVFDGAISFFSLQEENQILRKQVQTLSAHEEVHRDLSYENERLRGLLKFRAKTRWKTIPTEVIGRELGPWSKSLLLDKGRQSGIREGMAVITPVGLVGRIVEVGPSTSRAILLTDPQFRVTAKLPEDQTFGLVMGSGKGECLLTYLPLDLKLKAGSVVLTGGGKSFAPEGIPVGKLKQAWKDSSEMYITARLEPAVSLNGVEEVLVVAWRPESGR